jgi:DNA-binding NarL/FixJ family response regulator
VFGERLLQLGRRTAAQGALENALSSFAQLGAQSWAERCASALGSARLRVHRTAGRTLLGHLSQRELQVALVIARGATNREAAASLYLSPKTIAAHLERIFQKLGIHRRSELARMVGVEEALGEEAPQGLRSLNHPRDDPAPAEARYEMGGET